MDGSRYPAAPAHNRRVTHLTQARRRRPVRRSGIARLERMHGGPLEDGAVNVEARAVARAVPAALGGVEVHEAAEVRAAQRDGMQSALLVAEDTLLPEAVAHHARLSLLRESASRGQRTVSDEVRPGLGVELREVRRGAQG